MYNYPLNENEQENRKIDEQCLAEIEDLIEKFKKKGTPVAGMFFIVKSLLNFNTINFIFKFILNFLPKLIIIRLNHRTYPRRR